MRRWRRRRRSGGDREALRKVLNIPFLDTMEWVHLDCCKLCVAETRLGYAAQNDK